uniref:Uncharacterized protein n=1 Tax=Arundo donax TaxID=35708 RepID=A0A0A9HSA0_ARUDO
MGKITLGTQKMLSSQVSIDSQQVKRIS